MLLNTYPKLNNNIFIYVLVLVLYNTVLFNCIYGIYTLILCKYIFFIYFYLLNKLENYYCSYALLIKCPVCNSRISAISLSGDIVR